MNLVFTHLPGEYEDTPLYVPCVYSFAWWIRRYTSLCTLYLLICLVNTRIYLFMYFVFTHLWMLPQATQLLVCGVFRALIISLCWVWFNVQNQRYSSLFVWRGFAGKMKLNELDGDKLQRQNLPSACEADKANILMYSKPGRERVLNNSYFQQRGALISTLATIIPPREYDRKQRTQICIKLPT